MAGFGRARKMGGESLPQPTVGELLQYAYGLLSRRAYSEREVTDRLERRLTRHYAPVGEEERAELVAGVLERLRDYRFVDDVRLAGSLARSRGMGSYRIQAKMLERGLDRKTAVAALEERDPDQEQAELERLVARNWERWRAAGQKAHARAYGFLSRRGFSSRAILQAIAGLRDPLGDSPSEQDELDNSLEDE